MLKDVTLSTYALTDLETAFDYLRLVEHDQVPHVARAVNRATATIESYTTRQLKSRVQSFRMSGNPKRIIYTPEWPLTAVTSILIYMSDGVTTYAPDLTGMTFQANGQILLAAQSFTGVGGYWSGQLYGDGWASNVQVDCTTGYSTSAHPTEMSALEGACLRLAQVYYQDWRNTVGRAQSVGVGGTSETLAMTDIPPDVECVLRQFRRVF